MADEPRILFDHETAPLTVVSAELREHLSSFIGPPTTPEVLEKIKADIMTFLDKLADRRRDEEPDYGYTLKVYIEDGQIYLDRTSKTLDNIIKENIGEA